MIPGYIQEILSRSSFVIGEGSLGHTIAVCKKTPYQSVGTLRKDVGLLERWCRRKMPKDYPWCDLPTMVVRSIPERTHYCKQYAIVDIYDPLMKGIESLLKTQE